MWLERKYMLNTFINELENTYNYKFTENGAIAHRSTGSKVYDLFAFGGAYRQRSEEDCLLLFKNAFNEDPDLALKCLFYLRDCRGGQGERRFFRICLKWLAKNYPEVVKKNLKHIPEYGRWDDLFVFINTSISLENAMIDFIRDQLALDMLDAIDNKAISLLGKWMPSENAHSFDTKRKATWIRKNLGMTSKQYRQMLSKLRTHLNILEKLMSSNRWDEIEFDKIPSKAGLVYRNAFARHDINRRYEEFAKSDTKVNASTLYPYEIVNKVTKHLSWSYRTTIDDTERAMINKYWDSQVDYLNGRSPKMLCVVDTSGSMTLGKNPLPIDVAISLGLYCAERMTGPFRNLYISFSRNPKLIKTEGVDFCDKVRRIYQQNLCENTDLIRVFDLLLDIANSNNVNKEDLPETICVISDMEIDAGSYQGNEDEVFVEMEKIRRKWRAYGFEMPRLVYWNVNARNNTILDKGDKVSFVSGCSPVIFKQVLTGKNGFDLMLEVLLNDRYKEIKA